MSIVKKIAIDDKEVAFKASAAIPRIYRLKFQRDIYKDLRLLEKSIGDGSEEGSDLDLFSLEMFENIAFIMAKHADPTIPDTPDEWLDDFNTFSIYQVLPEIIELWGLNVQTEAESKKNFAKQSGMQVVAATEKASQSYLTIDYTKPTLLIMGSEDTGISNELLKLADYRAALPIRGEVQSLNVSVAAAIFMYEALRQREGSAEE